MGNKHEQKFIILLLAGLICTSAGIASIMYVIFSQTQKDDVVLWTAIPVVSVNTGLFCIARSVVHKVKADLIRKQKQRSRTDRES